MNDPRVWNHDPPKYMAELEKLAATYMQNVAAGVMTLDEALDKLGFNATLEQRGWVDRYYNPAHHDLKAPQTFYDKETGEQI